MSTRSWLPLFPFALCLIVPACSRNDPTPTPRVVKDGVQATPPEKVTAIELAGHLRENRGSTQTKYGKRQLEVTGVVLWSSQEYLGDPTVKLVGIEPPKDQPKKGKGKKRDEIGPDGLKVDYEHTELVECRFPKDRVLSVVALVPGQTVTIRGTFAGTPLARLDKSEIVSAGEAPVKTYTLAELRKTLGKDRSSVLVEKLSGPLIATGTVKSVEAGKAANDPYVITAEDASASADPPLTVQLKVWIGSTTPPLYAEYVKGLKPGSPLRVYGRLRLRLQGETLDVDGGRIRGLLPQ